MKFVQARNYTPTNGRQIDLIVIHDMETPEDTTRAESVADWFAGPNAPKASAHYQIDNNSIVQSVRDQDVAWHAPGANHNGIGLEHAGRAAQSLSDWLDPYSMSMLKDQSAPLTRDLCTKYSIPVRFVDAAGLLRGERGITTHNEVTKAFHKSSHTDPGPNFPMAQYLSWVNGSVAPQPQPEPPPKPKEVDMTPATVITTNGKKFHYVVGTNKKAYEHGRLDHPETNDKGFREIGGTWTSGLSAAPEPNGGVSISGRGTEGHLWEFVLDGSGKITAKNDLGGQIYAPA